MVMVPEDGISVIVCSRVEPKVNSLLTITLAMSVHVGLHRVWLPAPVPQELEVQLVADGVGVRVQLQAPTIT